MRKQPLTKSVCAIIAFLNWLALNWYFIAHLGQFETGQIFPLLLYWFMFGLLAYGTYQAAIKE